MVLTKRARSETQKTERRQVILQAARALFQTQAFPEINMAEIARRAGMAKGTVFLYFKTKEALFLCLTAQEFEAMCDALDERIAAWKKARRSAGHAEKTRLMGMLQQVMGPRELLVRLIAIQHIVLERNITYPEARDFKLMLTRRVNRTGGLLDETVSFFQPGQGARFMIWMYAFVIGFAHVAAPAPVIRQVYQREPEVRKLTVDFGAEYFAAIDAVWDGWRNKSRQARRTPTKTRRNA